MKRIIALALLLAAALLLPGCDRGAGSASGAGKFRIVTSFYPVYIAAANIAQGIDGVEVVNMTRPQTGCLHDYQLTTEDMRTLESADVFVVNGLGMESFLEKAMESKKDLKIIDASDTDKIRPITEEDGTPNPHVWMSVTYAIEQAKAITAGLAEADPAHEKEYKKNALDYVTKLSALREKMHGDLDGLPQKEIVTFHEAFPYFAKEFGLHIAAVIEREPGTEPTPKEMEEAIARIREHSVKAVFTEPQYAPSAAETIASETGAAMFTLDPVVTGEADERAMDAYIEAMERNARFLADYAWAVTPAPMIEHRKTI